MGSPTTGPWYLTQDGFLAFLEGRLDSVFWGHAAHSDPWKWPVLSAFGISTQLHPKPSQRNLDSEAESHTRVTLVGFPAIHPGSRDFRAWRVKGFKVEGLGMQGSEFVGFRVSKGFRQGLCPRDPHQESVAMWREIFRGMNGHAELESLGL